MIHSIKGLKEISDTSVLLFIEDTIDKRSKIYKFLSKQGHAACFEPMKIRNCHNGLRYC